MAPQHPSIRRESLHLEPDLRPDEIAALQHQGAVWIAWSGGTLDEEHVGLGELTTAGLRVAQRYPGGFRPALASGRDPDPGAAPALAFCAPGAGPTAGWLARGADVTRIPLAGSVVHETSLATAGRTGQLIVAAAIGAGERSEIAVLEARPEAPPRELARLPGTSPRLAGANDGLVLAWIHEGRVNLGRVGAAGVERVCLPSPPAPAGLPAGAPALAPAGPRSWFVAWHAPVGDGVLRWIHLARCTLDGEVDPLGPYPCASDLQAAGEDQGWERPALAVDAHGTVWLAGRSSGGFHAQALGPGGWTPRAALTDPGWSGRSRTCALVVAGASLLLVRGEPSGLRVEALTLGRDRPGVASTAHGSTGVPAAPAPLVATPLVATPRRTAPSKRGLLFGDIHQHTSHSDGTGGAEEAYTQARDRYGHDLVAVTDHERLGPRSIGPSTWRYLCEVADAFYEPGRLVTLPAYEFTGARLPGPGHKCVYFGDDVPPALPHKERQALERVLRDHGAIAVPHHVAWTGADIEHHDPELQPVWEICSVHGAYERAGAHPIPPRQDVLLPDQFIGDALDAGLVFGLVGGTDSHGLRWHHGVGRRANPYRTGLTAVFAEPTREAVLRALRERRCYATSGARIVLEVDADGAPMGAQIQHPSPRLHVSLVGTAPVSRLSVIVDGCEAHVESGDAELEITLRVTPRESGSYCYVRVLQADGEMAWSSPIWIRP